MHPYYYYKSSYFSLALGHKCSHSCLCPHLCLHTFFHQNDVIGQSHMIGMEFPPVQKFCWESNVILMAKLLNWRNWNWRITANYKLCKLAFCACTDWISALVPVLTVVALGGGVFLGLHLPNVYKYWNELSYYRSGLCVPTTSDCHYHWVHSSYIHFWAKEQFIGPHHLSKFWGKKPKATKYWANLAIIVK